MGWLDIEDTLKLLEESEKTGEEVSVQCPPDISCEGCPFSNYCK